MVHSPIENAAFVAAMEDILDLYCLPENPMVLIINMDEQPFQRLGQTQDLVPMRLCKELREDDEYVRHGTASIFTFTYALGKWRRTSVRKQRTAVDWAEEIRILLAKDYPDADRIFLICDNLNTHTVASLYKTFPAPEARRLAKRLSIHYTPKHGSWLNIEECEMSVLVPR